MALTAKEQRDLAKFALRQFRRLSKPEREQSSVPIEYVPARRIVVTLENHEQPAMSLPACLMRGQCEAAKERGREVLFNRAFWASRVGGLNWNRRRPQYEQQQGA